MKLVLNPSLKGDDRYRAILKAREDGASLTTIARALNTSKQRVHQILNPQPKAPNPLKPRNQKVWETQDAYVQKIRDMAEMKRIIREYNLSLDDCLQLAGLAPLEKQK
jgi:hypothetical protein